jgi:poly(3-hydroxybutyrate) depolymerase
LRSEITVYRLTLAIALYALSFAVVRAAPAEAEEMASFEFVNTARIAITVWYYLPPAVEADTRVVFLLHGDSRTAREARDLGAPYARDGRFILLAPEFDEEHFPGDLYSLGGMVDATRRLRPRNDWSLLIIEQLFEHVRVRWKLTATTYDAIGHSGGAQFLHRLVLFVPEARFARAIASSPGRYAFPTVAEQVPYGMGGTDAAALLKRAFQRDFVLLLADRDTADRVREPEAMAEGANRFTRGLRFFATAVEQANELGVPFHWQLRITQGVDHSPREAVAAAFAVLAERASPQRTPVH